MASAVSKPPTKNSRANKLTVITQPPSGDHQPSSKQQPSTHYQPFSLTFAEISNPYIVLQDIFSTVGINGTRELLKEWFLKSLSPVDDTGEMLELIEEYQRMEKLVEANWLIFMSKNDTRTAADGRE